MIVKNAFKFALLALATTAVTAAPEKRAPKPKAVVSSSAAASSAGTPTTAVASPATTTGVYPNNWNWQTQYPPLFDKSGAWLVAPTDSALAKQWISSINMSAVAKAPVIKWDKNGNPINPFGTANPYCDWTFDGVCTRPEDVVYCPQKGVFGLTFDDGPTQFSPTLYDTLAKTNQKATLFYIGLMVAQYPQHAQRACAEGHQIAIHTWSHHVLTSLTTEQVIAELKWTEAIIKEVCGISPRYFRPPQGDYDDRIRNIASQLGFIPVLWDLDTNDWTNGSPGGVTAAQEDANFTKWESQVTTDTHGHICLQHELSQFAVDEAAVNLPNLVKAYNVVPVASCIGDAHPYKESTVFFPILDASGKLTWTNTTNTTTPAASGASGTASAGGTGTATAAGAASGSVSGSPVSTTTSSATRASVAQILFAFVAVLAVAISF